MISGHLVCLVTNLGKMYNSSILEYFLLICVYFLWIAVATNFEGQVPIYIYIFPRNKVVQLYPRHCIPCCRLLRLAGVRKYSNLPLHFHFKYTTAKLDLGCTLCGNGLEYFHRSPCES
jgi:hypothetical protein